jgi:hypothetical protein
MASDASHLIGFVAHGEDEQAPPQPVTLYLSDETFDSEIVGPTGFRQAGPTIRMTLSPPAVPGGVPSSSVFVNDTDVSAESTIDMMTPGIVALTGAPLAAQIELTADKNNHLVVSIDSAPGAVLVLDPQIYSPTTLADLLAGKFKAAGLNGKVELTASGALCLSTLGTDIDASIELLSGDAEAPLGLAKPTPMMQVLTPEQAQSVRVTIDMPEIMRVHPTDPAHAVFLLGWDGASFSGRITPVDQTTGTLLPTCGWRGTLRSAPQALAAEAAARAAAESAPITLSLADLMSLDVSAAHDIAKSRFQEYIVATCEDQWRKDLLGRDAPPLDQFDDQVISAHKDFYTNKESPNLRYI